VHGTPPAQIANLDIYKISQTSLTRRSAAIRREGNKIRHNKIQAKLHATQLAQGAKMLRKVRTRVG